MSKFIDISHADGVATVTLNQPEKHNAFDDAIIDQLTTAFKKIDADDSVRVMVLSANGKSFSAGADLAWMKRMAGYTKEENLNDARALAAMLKTLNSLRMPTIARVQGAAFGGAVGLVSCCDMAVASERASFCLSEVRIGLIPATISPYVIEAIGPRAARRYFMTAERFNAHTAHKLGLVSEVTNETELDSCISDLIKNLLANGPRATSEAKRLVADVANAQIDQRLIDETSQRIASIRTSEEGQEGLNAFLEKRTANWIKHK